jgi:hypothetical protein
MDRHMPERLTGSDIGCWVIKSRRAPEEIDPTWSAGGVRTLTRCLRRSYRLQLMVVGQPCLLWLSGREAGVQALGHVAAPPPDPSVEVTLHRLAEPLPRGDVMTHPVLSGAEVIRMPAGSNPSFLSPERWSVLRELLAPDDLWGTAWKRYPPGV